MRTRGLTAVILDGKHRVAQYGQWDHYPSGQGIDVLEFCRKHLGSIKKRNKFKTAVRKTRFIDDAEYAKMYASVGVDIIASDGLVSLAKSKEFCARYPSLHRDTGSEILTLVLNGETRLQDSFDFASDSLFCEGVFLIDLDREIYEVYDGGQEVPHNQGRFAGNVIKARNGAVQYYPVKLAASFKLSGLPSNEAFLEILEPPEEVEQGPTFQEVATVQIESGRAINKPRELHVKDALAMIRHYCDAHGLDYGKLSGAATRLYRRQAGADKLTSK